MAKKTTPKTGRKTAAKRELIDTGSDKGYVRRVQRVASRNPTTSANQFIARSIDITRGVVLSAG